MAMMMIIIIVEQSEFFSCTENRDISTRLQTSKHDVSDKGVLLGRITIHLGDIL